MYKSFLRLVSDPYVPEVSGLMVFESLFAAILIIPDSLDLSAERVLLMSLG